MKKGYYDGSVFQFTPENKVYIDVRKRSKGRTSYWLNRLIKRAIDAPSHKFMLVRRSREEMDDVESYGLAKNMLNTDYYGRWYDRHGYRIFTKGGKIYVVDIKNNEQQVGYLQTLNNVKGIDADDVDVILFDEFIAVNRRDYKGGNGGEREPKILMKLIHSVFRRRQLTWLIMLGNDESPSNPYNEYFKIPYGVKRYKDDKGLLYIYDDSPADLDSTASILTSYDDQMTQETNGQRTIVPDYMIGNKPPSAEMIFTVYYKDTPLTFWIDYKTSILYAHSNYKCDNTRPVYTAFKEDMTVNTAFILARVYPQIKMLKDSVQRQSIRYDTQMTAYKVETIKNLIQ